MSKEEVQAYFGRPGFERFLQRLQRQYRSSKAGARGYIMIESIRDDEREVLDAFFEKYSPPDPNENKRYSVKEFERLLERSRFSIKIPRLLEIVCGAPVLTRREREDRIGMRWERMIRESIEAELAGAAATASEERVLGWAAGLLDESSPGSRMLRLLFFKSPIEAERSLIQCFRALKIIVSEPRQRPVRLPILAARIAGDAHALDWKHPLGRLFWRALVYVHTPYSLSELGTRNEPEREEQEGEADYSEDVDASSLTPSQAMFIREGYRRGGVADDDLSSQVLIFAPELFGGNEERILTLRQVERLGEEQLEPLRISFVAMVENPSIFAELMDDYMAKMTKQELGGETEGFAPILVCGNGQPSTAVIGLLDRLLDCTIGFFNERVLYYSGDLDAAGILIAQSLQSRYGYRFRAWRMDKEVYLAHSISGISMSDEERERMMNIHCIWEPDLGATMQQVGVKLHQELWKDELLQDFLQLIKEANVAGA